MSDQLPEEPHVVAIEDHGPRGTPAQHKKMEKLEGQLSDHETKAREVLKGENAALIEPPKGWIDPKGLPTP